MRLSAARATVVAFLFVTPTAAADVQSFTLGHVDLLDLAANAPLGTVPAARPPAPAPPEPCASCTSWSSRSSGTT